MNIESLKYFYLIAKAGNISSVAKEVHLSQSALSQQIQRLENDFSKKLLIRSNKGVVLTSLGKIVYKFADNILRTYDKMMVELAEEEKGSVIIKIEACRFIASYALPCTLIKANGVYPNHNYELSGNTSQEIISNVANNICDVGFMCDSELKADSNVIVSTKVGVSKIVLVSKNEETVPDVISVEELLDGCIITFTGKNDITSFMNRNLKRMGYDENSLNCNLRVEGIESAKMLLQRSYGFAFLPYFSVKEELYKKQFKVIEVPDFTMEVDITMLYKNDHSTRVNDFLEWFKKNGKQSFC